MEEESYIYIDSRSRSASPDALTQDIDTTTLYLKQFIDAYKSLPSLWDRTNQNYSNKRQRNEDLDKLTKILRYLKPYATREDTRKKVNSLRSNFRKELVKIHNSKRSGAGKIYKPTSSTFYMLKFLTKCEDTILSQGESDEDEDKADNSTFSFQNEEPLPKTRRLIRKSRIARRNELSKARTLLSRPVQSQPTVEPIALVWAEKIKRLNAAQRLHAEKAINDILYEAEVQSLNESLNQQAPSPTPAMCFIPSPNSEKTKSDLVVSKEERFEC